MIRSGSLYGFITDALGSVRLVVKVSDGSIAQELRYDAWGNVTSDTAQGFQMETVAGRTQRQDLDRGTVRLRLRRVGLQPDRSPHP